MEKERNFKRNDAQRSYMIGKENRVNFQVMSEDG